MGRESAPRIEDVPGEIERGPEADIERVERVKNEIREALIFTSCPDADGFGDCMNDWLNRNDDKFGESFAQLLDARPNLIEEWETVDFRTRDEILDILNGVLRENGSEMGVAA